MEINALRLEILEAKRLIERNEMILGLNDQLISALAELKTLSEQKAAADGTI